MQQIQVIDSHSEGEPTRVVLAGGPDLGPGTAAQRLQVFQHEYDWFRQAVTLEPRGSDALVGALLCEPNPTAEGQPAAAAQVLFFNNVGYLGMCVHGSLGVAATLQHLGRIGPGKHLLQTPVGDVTMILAESGEIAVQNVMSYRHVGGVTVRTEKHGLVTGDVAYGGNWFFLVNDHQQELRFSRLAELTACTQDIMDSLERARITGTEGQKPPVSG